jgi:hypothetical protein
MREARGGARRDGSRRYRPLSGRGDSLDYRGVTVSDESGPAMSLGATDLGQVARARAICPFSVIARAHTHGGTLCVCVSAPNPPASPLRPDQSDQGAAPHQTGETTLRSSWTAEAWDGSSSPQSTQAAARPHQAAAWRGKACRELGDISGDGVVLRTGFRPPDYAPIRAPVHACPGYPPVFGAARLQRGGQVATVPATPVHARVHDRHLPLPPRFHTAS